eukprot:4534539-Prymnesium_polylepis.1
MWPCAPSSARPSSIDLASVMHPSSSGDGSLVGLTSRTSNFSGAFVCSGFITSKMPLASAVLTST